MLEVSLCKTLSAVVMAVASGQVADIDSQARELCRSVRGA